MADVEDAIEDEDETEAMTAAEVLHKLEEAWLNEKHAPEILENKMEIVECMMDQITEMEENIRRAKKGDFKVSIHQMEIDRIRYVLSSYLRIRLEKIENYAAYLLETEEKRKADESPLLSPEELQYAREFQESMEAHMKDLALRHMPSNLQTLDPKHTIIKPNLDSYVFLKVLENQEGVLVEEESSEVGEDVIDLTKGDQHIMRYRPISTLVSSSVVSLI